MTVGELRKLPGWVAQYNSPRRGPLYWSSSKRFWTNVKADITIYKTKKEAAEDTYGRGGPGKIIRTDEM